MTSAPEMPKVVLDSSTLISAFLTPQGTCAEVLRRAQGHYELCLSDEIMAETASSLLHDEKSQARYGYEREEVEKFILALDAAATIVSELPQERMVPNDPKDDIIIGTALRAEAQFVITGDRNHLLVLGEYQDIAIITPRQFLDMLDQGHQEKAA